MEYAIPFNRPSMAGNEQGYILGASTSADQSSEEAGDPRGFPLSAVASTNLGRQFGGRLGGYSVTDHISDRLLRLPFFTSLADTDLEIVVEAIRAFDGL